MSTPNPTHIDVIIEHRWRDGKGCNCTWFPDYRNTHKSGLEMHGEHVVSKLTDAGYSIVRVECDGSGTCPVSLHIHGCFSDDGNNCDNPEDHICDCGTCVAIEAARAERAAAAEGEKP